MILTYALNQEIVVVSLNGYIHCWNALRMKQVCNTPDLYCDFNENVKLARLIYFKLIYYLKTFPRLCQRGYHTH